MVRVLAAVILVLLTSELARGQSCDAALAMCEQDLAAREQVRQTCVFDLAEALTYGALFDACQRSRPAVRDRDRQTCRRLDWQNDEPHQVIALASGRRGWVRTRPISDQSSRPRTLYETLAR